MLGKDTGCQLLRRHFEAEKADDCAVGGFSRSVLPLHGFVRLGDVEGDVGRKCRLAHGGTAGKDYEVRVLQPAHHPVQILEARRKPGKTAIALIRLGRHFDGIGRRVAERHET